MNEQLLISGVLEHAIKNNANTEIVSNTVEGGIHRYTIKDSAKRSKKLANALLNLSIKEGGYNCHNGGKQLSPFRTLFWHFRIGSCSPYS